MSDNEKKVSEDIDKAVSEAIISFKRLRWMVTQFGTNTDIERFEAIGGLGFEEILEEVLNDYRKGNDAKHYLTRKEFKPLF